MTPLGYLVGCQHFLRSESTHVFTARIHSMTKVMFLLCASVHRAPRVKVLGPPRSKSGSRSRGPQVKVRGPRSRSQSRSGPPPGQGLEGPPRSRSRSRSGGPPGQGPEGPPDQGLGQGLGGAQVKVGKKMDKILDKKWSKFWTKKLDNILETFGGGGLLQ